MNLLEQLAADDHEQVIAFQNRAAGLRGFLAIHDTTLGPALGGKAVILDHPGLKRAEAFEAYGRLVGSLRGRFYTGTDVGVTPEDLAAVGRGTSHVACESTPELGDINEHTARGVWYGMRACLEAVGLKARAGGAARRGRGGDAAGTNPAARGDGADSGRPEPRARAAG